MIELRQVTKRYGAQVILKGISFTVPESKTFALLGLSGSGKTTALKAVCGLVSPDSGEIFVKGVPVNPSRIAEVRSQLGYVIQDGGLFPHLTAYDNLKLVGLEEGWSSEKIRSRIDELAQIASLPTHLLSAYPRKLSGGQRQRVGIMRALFRDPSILLLDEPLGALDPITRSELQAELKALFERLGKTVLVVTHDVFEAEHLSHRILLLNGGSIVQSGTLAEILAAPANDFVSRFVSAQRPLEKLQ